ncbi:MAG: hypothetical protein QM756_35120 [Polyangiaceae bacterium]
MQNQFPVGSAGAYAPNAVSKPAGGFLSQFSLMEKLKFAGFALLIVGALVVWLVVSRRQHANVVVFENSLSKPGELTLNGKSYGTIAPRQHLRLELDSASYALSFGGAGEKLDEGTLVVPEVKSGIETMGMRAVYNLGGKKGLAVVTKMYGGSMKDSVRPVEEGKRLIEVPYQNIDGVDEAFPATVTVRKGQSFGSVTRVCHVDEEKETVACPGW